MDISELNLELIKKHCSKIYESGVELYHGFNRSNTKQEQFIGTIRTDRKPLSSSLADVMVFDDIMELMGFPHRKANTFSLTKHKVQAGSYGILYRIFPFDDAQYLTSNLRDLIALPYYAKKAAYNMPFLDHPDINDVSEIHNWVEKNKLIFEVERDLAITNNPKELIDFKFGEILLYGSKYIAIKENNYFGGAHV